MKAKASLLLAVILCVVVAAPAFAQTAKSERELQNILQRHPKLAANPSLVNNPNWQRNNPEVYDWFQKHPKIMAQTRHMGAWQTNGTWREPNWWFQNNPNWVYQNQPNWIQQNPNWRQQGDWYEGKWHNRNWYVQNQPEWVKRHRPEWAKQEGRGHKGPPQGPPPGQYKPKQHPHDHHGDQH
jgi:hypothetical protein